MSVRVVAGSVILLLVLLCTYLYITISYTDAQMTLQIQDSANRVSDIIKQSTRYSMLLNRNEDVYQIISTVGKEPGVEGIRIYNKRGEIIFSTDAKEQNTIVDLRAEACYGCHSQEKPLESLASTNRVRVYQGPAGYRLMGVINPIRNEPACSNGDCHAHPVERSVLGVLDVRMSLKATDKNAAATQRTMILYALVMAVVVTGIVVAYLTGTVLRPVRHLMRGAQAITAGNLDYHIRISQNDELGRLADAFNDMTHSLKHEKEENHRWAETLQERVQEKTDELKAIHGQIVHIEKMASLGKLSATVAHELNNPLEAILTYAKLIARRMRKDEARLAENAQTIEEVELIARETDRCGAIVKNLLLFSRKNVGEFVLFPVQQIVEKAASLVRHHCQMANVRFEARYADPAIMLTCDQNQIQQALLALFVNAVEAMTGGGTIVVDVRKESGDDVVITVADTGSGILPEDLPHIFEPFYTTKKGGKGVGLGLSVVYGIVERHGGTITAHSVPGASTVFTLRFPKLPAAQRRSEDIAPSNIRENV
jgi:two-component system NtrC family sensor kinase